MKKLLVCDIEGTIFKAKYKIEGTDYASTMWQPLAKVLGQKAIEEEKNTHRKWKNQKFNNYLDWVNATVDIHKKYKLQKDDFNRLINSAEYVDGVVDFFKNLDRSKYIPVLVSGGFQELARRAQAELGINYGYGACEYFFNEKTGILESHSMTPCDFEGKYNFIKYLFDIYDLNKLTDWIFVGDGKNDIHIAGKAPLSFGINAHPELAGIVNHNVKNFSEIDQYLKQEKKTINVSSGEGIRTNGLEVNPDNDYEEILTEILTINQNIKSVNLAIEKIKEDNSILNALLYESSKENEENKARASRINELKHQHENEKESLITRIEKLTEKQEREEEKRRRLLKDSWEIHFPNFTFDSGPIRDISKLNYKERLLVEKSLKELHDTKDSRTLSRGKLSTGNDHMGLRLQNGFPARIEYSRVDKKDQKLIRIITFYKHNKKYMQ